MSLKQLRLAKGMSQKALAKLVKTSQPTLFRLETGLATRVDYKLIVALADVLGPEVYDLFRAKKEAV